MQKPAEVGQPTTGNKGDRAGVNKPGPEGIKVPPPAEVKPGVYSTGAIKGKKLKSLFTDYTGIKGVCPAKVKVDFEEHLRKMWDYKVKRSGNGVVNTVRSELLAEYRTKRHTKMSLDDYIDEADRSVREVNRYIAWDKLGRIKRLDKEELDLTKRIAKSLDGKDIIVYSLTELMPSSDGKLNVDVLDFLLRNAGREYVESIPAKFDSKTSFGPYQFTEYALYDDGREQRGASIINRALGKGNIPGSVRYLRGNDHHKAAYLFAIENIARLVKSCNRKQLAALKRRGWKKKEDVLKYIATAHHGPAGALKIAKRWLDNGARSDYQVSCHGRFRGYAKKTGANYRAIHKR